MRYREITEEQAAAVADILVEECAFRVHDDRDRASFIRTILASVRADQRYICNEYRFMGGLGFGGKFRNNGNNENVPYVDCYREDETPARNEMIRRANERLAALFGPAP